MDTSELRRLALGTVIAIWRKRIRVITHGAELKQVDLQRRAQLPTGSVSRIERGETSPGPEDLRRIAEALKTDVAELMRESDLLFDLLRSALGPLDLGGDYAPLPPSEDEVAEGHAKMPERLRRRWEALLHAERSLAQQRSLLEYETTVDASRSGASEGGR